MQDARNGLGLLAKFGEPLHFHLAEHIKLFLNRFAEVWSKKSLQ